MLKQNNSYHVRSTTWGGRACFALKEIPKGTEVLQTDDIVGSTIEYQYRKEVCHNCFRYKSGNNMKHLDSNDYTLHLKSTNTIASVRSFRGAGLWFCESSCLDEYLSHPYAIDLINTLEALLNHFLTYRNSDHGNESQVSDPNSVEDLEHKWQEIDEHWGPMIKQTKATKRYKYLPAINEDEYVYARFVIVSVFRMSNLDQNSDLYRTFINLQSNEYEKTTKFPNLLNFEVRLYKMIFILLPSHINMTTVMFRHIIGTEYGNAFGTWTNAQSKDSRDYLGLAVYPYASLFNHSCEPSLELLRNRKTLSFVTIRDLTPGDELSIGYGNTAGLGLEERRAYLKSNWYFDCYCHRCSLELSELEAPNIVL